MGRERGNIPLVNFSPAVYYLNPWCRLRKARDRKIQFDRFMKISVKMRQVRMLSEYLMKDFNNRMGNCFSL